MEYSELYANIRVAAGDLGDYDSSGTLITDSYRYNDTIIDNAITMVLLEDTTYSKVSGSNEITPDFTSDKARALFCYRVAKSLVLSDLLREHSNREGRFRRDLTMLIANIMGKIKTLESADTGIPRADDGAAEAMWDMADRIETFTSENT